MSKSDYKLNSNEGNEGDSHWLPVGDLMAGLMFLFILALAAFLLNMTELFEEIEGNNILREELLNDIKNEMEEVHELELIVIENQGIIRLEQGVLFETGQADLRDSGEILLSALGEVMYAVLSREKYTDEVNTIFIEGHTDSDPIVFSQDFQTNWDLSAFRAINTWKYLSDAENRLEDLRNENYEPLFSISGYADTRPVATNETEEGKRQNRRIDLRVNMNPPERNEGLMLEEEINRDLDN